MEWNNGCLLDYYCLDVNVVYYFMIKCKGCDVKFVFGFYNIYGRVNVVLLNFGM